jgi:uncharacterized protein (TIGR04255 family)
VRDRARDPRSAGPAVVPRGYAVVLSSREATSIDDLISFGRPPVSEVVLGVQFSEPVVDLDVLATFVLRTRGELPGREQHDPLATVEETFAATPAPRRIQLRVVPGFVLPRAWFISADDSQLVQLQADRFVFNWRRMRPHDRYPRYAKLRPVFERHLATLRSCLVEAGRPPGAVNLAEVTYINELSWPDAPNDQHPPLSRALQVVGDVSGEGFLPQAEDTTFHTRFRIPDPQTDETPAGRLYVSAEPALRSADLVPIYLLKMTAHIVMPMPDDSAMIRALDLGREWAVRAFDQVTTPEFKAVWQPVPAEEA